MKKRVVALLMVGVVAASMLAACGTKKEGTKSTKSETKTTGSTKSEKPAAEGDVSGFDIQVIAKGFQHQYWQAVKQGAEEAQKKLGIKSMNFVGPDTESNIEQQITQLKTALSKKPAAICFAALSVDASLDALNEAKASGIPVIGFDSGVPNAPEGSVFGNAATDNKAAGALAAEKMYELIKDKVTDPKEEVKIQVLSQDATSESIIGRTQGFLDKMAELIGADKVSIIGNDKFNKKVDGAKVILNIQVPATIDDASCVNIATNALNDAATVAIYGSNEMTAKNMVIADNSANKLGKDIIGVGFDAGEIQLQAVKDKRLSGSITQDPVAIGYKAVEMAVKAAQTKQVQGDIDTGAKWYNADNMYNDDIKPCLYDIEKIK
ncbi:MAG: substrate-binding domain-containing protein [Lachnospiraceae bacterium]|nr:substrate-binding domain-containing protein [Lachnospiraceae bacterium]MDY5742868.1 substrate-binding domain-containing protein [Lachnospiraceae bacterium]